MKHVICLAVASLLATTANAAEMKWSGSAGWRYEQGSLDSSLSGAGAVQKSRAHGLRANLGVSGGWEHVEWGVGVRTNGGAANDDHVALNSSLDSAIGFEQAWLRYVHDFGALDVGVTVGRQKNVFAYDNVAQTLFDNDVRFDGLGWQFKFGMFNFNAAQYVLGARNQGVEGGSSLTRSDASDANNNTQSQMNYLFGFQPTMNWKFADDIEAMFGVGYYMWKDSSKFNQVYTGANLATTNGFNLRDSRQWQFTTAWTLPYNLSFNGEFVMNKKQQYDANTIRSIPTSTNTTSANAFTGTATDADRTAWSAGLTYGSLKKAHDFSIGYAYGSKGLASVYNAYSYEKFLANQKGHTIEVAYAVADNFHLGWKGLFLKEKNTTDPTTGLAFTGANAAREIKNNYWEVTAGVMF